MNDNKTFTQLLSEYFDARINSYHHTKIPNEPTNEQIERLGNNIKSAEDAMESFIKENKC
jgi:hypothetical protein